MYEIVDRGVPGTLGIRVNGAMAEAEFDRLRQEMAGILDEQAPLNIVFEVVPATEVLPNVLWEDMRFLESRAAQLGRMALVAEPRWAPVVEIVGDAGFESRHFDVADSDAAWAWAAGG